MEKARFLCVSPSLLCVTVVLQLLRQEIRFKMPKLLFQAFRILHDNSRLQFSNRSCDWF